MLSPLIRPVSTVTPATEGIHAYRTSRLRVKTAWSREERLVSNTLARFCPAGERVIAYTKGELFGLPRGWEAGDMVYLGLTATRLMLINPLVPQNGAIILSRDLVKEMSWKSGPRILAIDLGTQTFTIQVNIKSWADRTESFLKIDRRLALPGGTASGDIDADMRHVRTLQYLGLKESADAMLDRRVIRTIAGRDGMFQTASTLRAQRTTLRVAALFLLVGGIVSLLLWMSGGGGSGFVAAWLGLSALVDLVLGTQLWRGYTRPWARISLYRLHLGPVVWAASALGTDEYLAFWLALPYSVALSLLLTGGRSRARTILALTIFTVGTGIVFLL